MFRNRHVITKIPEIIENMLSVPITCTHEAANLPKIYFFRRQ